MTFDEVTEIICGDTLGVDVSDEPGKKDFIIKDDMVATGREALLFLINELRRTYAPTVEMTDREYKIFKSAKVDEDSADWLDEIYWEKVDYNYPKFMQAWLHPETIKVVGDE